MNVRQLLKDYSIPFITEGEGPHATRGWINVHCPFCAGSKNFHLGIPEDGSAAHCWRCGGHSIVATISKLLRVSEQEARRILRKYQQGPTVIRASPEPIVRIRPFRFPKPHYPLSGPYKSYLARREFDPDRLEKEWGLLQTGPSSYLDGINYSHRILIPIHWDGRVVSFQARDITDRSERKYLACPRQRETVHHKNVVYGKEDHWRGASGIIVVEGPADVWRLGPCAVATFGIEFTLEQVLQLARISDRLFVVYDCEPQAQQQARRLAVRLRALGKQGEVVTIDSEDPGSMSQDDADYFVKQLLG